MHTSKLNLGLRQNLNVGGGLIYYSQLYNEGTEKLEH